MVREQVEFSKILIKMKNYTEICFQNAPRMPFLGVKIYGAVQICFMTPKQQIP